MKYAVRSQDLEHDPEYDKLTEAERSVALKNAEKKRIACAVIITLYRKQGILISNEDWADALCDDFDLDKDEVRAMALPSKLEPS